MTQRNSHSLYFYSSVAILALYLMTPLTAQGAPSCAGASNHINQTFSNGAKWDVCWEVRWREGLVYYDMYFTPSGGSEIKIINTANLAQIHVPYDDDLGRFHDLTDFGLGTTPNLNHLDIVDCPNGTLINHNGKNVLCTILDTYEHAWMSSTNERIGESLRIFSVSDVGEYNYIPEWRLYDDGGMEPGVGATGALQRFTSDSTHGWKVRPDGTSSQLYGASHIHNYYWRLDFDIGTSSTDEVFEEIEAQVQAGNLQRNIVVTPLSQEAALSVDHDSLKSWRIRDTTQTNALGRPISVEILPLEMGHQDVGPATEPFTHNDIYVTRFRACELFASHNPEDIPNGCAANEDLSDFVDGENLSGEDIVVWFGMTFHHIPRDEDQPYMSAHWSRFRIQPRDLYVDNDGAWIELTNPSPDSGDRAGYSVATDGDYAVVGVRMDDTGGFSNNGTASIYKRDVNNIWSHLTSVQNTVNMHDQAHFGHAVALSGSLLVVGEESQNQNGFRAGRVHVYAKDTGGVDNWGLAWSNAGLDTVAGDYFGRDVAIDGTTLVVGAHNADPLGNRSGAAYVFDASTGTQITKLIPNDGAEGDKFGNAVAISGDNIVVGSFRDDDNATNSGSAYVFSRNQGGADNWGQVKKLVASDPVISDQFAYSVSISNDTIAIGSRYADFNTLKQTGAVYTFDRNEGGVDNWGQTQRIVAADALAGDRLGWSVDIDGDRIISGAPQRDDFGDKSGKVYLFQKNSGVWSESAQLITIETSTRDEFGVGVAINASFALIGAWLDNRPTNNTGGAYLFGL